VYLFVEEISLDKLIAQACATAIVTVITFLSIRAGRSGMHPTWRRPTPTPDSEPGRLSRTHAARRAQ